MIGYFLAALLLCLMGVLAPASAERIGPEFKIAENGMRVNGPYLPTPITATTKMAGGLVTFFTSPYSRVPYGPTFGQRFTADGTLKGGFQVTQPNINTFAPSAALLKSKIVVVSWTVSPKRGATGVYFRRYSSGGAPLGAVVRVDTRGADNGQIAALADGRFAILWAGTRKDGRNAVFARLFGPGGVAASPDLQVSPAFKTMPQPKVASLSTGGFVACWTIYLAPREDVGCERHDNQGNKVGNTWRVTSSAAGSLTTVAGLQNNSFVVLWNVVVSGHHQIVGQLYANNGMPVGGQFQISKSGVDFGGDNIDVTPLSSGNFVITWRESTTVFGQRYTADGALRGNQFGVKIVADDWALWLRDVQGLSVVALEADAFLVIYVKHSFLDADYTSEFQTIYGRRFDP